MVALIEAARDPDYPANCHRHLQPAQRTGLERARAAGIEALAIDHRGAPREAFDDAVGLPCVAKASTSSATPASCGFE